MEKDEEGGGWVEFVIRFVDFKVGSVWVLEERGLVYVGIRK